MFKVKIFTQPDDETCGPTSLHAVYNYFKDNIDLRTVIKEVDRSHTGGTLAPMLAKHALQRGYQAHIYAYNLDVFDPSWFKPKKLVPEQVIEKLAQQRKIKHSIRIRESSKAYEEFLSLGGQLHFRDLTFGLLKHYFDLNIPILTGLGATYLYQSPREFEMLNGNLVYDDLKGEPCGHFVVISGYDEHKRNIVVADPHRKNPMSRNNYYKVKLSRLVNAIMLGVLTHDANLLLTFPKDYKVEMYKD